jgi:hypothetical protein
MPWLFDPFVYVLFFPDFPIVQTSQSLLRILKWQVFYLDETTGERITVMSNMTSDPDPFQKENPQLQPSLDLRPYSL